MAHTTSGTVEAVGGGLGVGAIVRVGDAVARGVGDGPRVGVAVDAGTSLVGLGVTEGEGSPDVAVCDAALLPHPASAIARMQAAVSM
ncbi:MAG TPA: hypothetical protein VKX16_12465 [Chloroflexota bacterium]|nr:hypothetical protein [Chloroflexota bacterium]